MTESLYRRFGDATFPPDPSANPETLFAAFDPELDRMLGLFKAALNAELGPAWTLARVGTALAASDPVQDTLWAQPTKAMLRAQKNSWPLLCLARVTGAHEELTLAKEQIVTTWSLDYLLGPLSGADYRRLAGALTAALKVLQLTIRELGHPDYQGGARQFEGFNTIGIKASAMGPASFGESGEGVEYFGLHLDLETSETDKALDGGTPDYIGATVVFGVGSEEILADEIIARTDAPLASP